VNTEARATPASRSEFARGFTQLELLVSMVLLGILSASVIPTMIPQAGKGTAAYQALRLADDLRHTRLLAMGWGQTLIFNSDATSWRVTCANPGSCHNGIPHASACPDPTSSVIDPGHHGPFCVALEHGVTLSGPASIQFDLLGRPQSLAPISYSISADGLTIAVVSVTADTGFVSTVAVQ
jgi:prepilin-type N-terminal cleavage/methylation domain-containing protein